VREKWLLCFPGRFVFGPRRSRQEQSDRREPVPAEHESLTLKNVQAAVSGRLRVSGGHHLARFHIIPRPPARVRHGLPLLSSLAKLRCVGSSASSGLRAGPSSYRTGSCPSVVIMDGQSVKTTERGGARGFYAHKRVKGPKRHILVDTLGLLVANRVEPADTSDRRAGRSAAWRIECIVSEDPEGNSRGRPRKPQARSNPETTPRMAATDRQETTTSVQNHGSDLDR
jgi:hypothetical protein